MDTASAYALARRAKPEAGPFGGWGLYSVPEDGAHHVLPEDDLRLHGLNLDCWCRPRADDESDHLIIHNSADGREMFERGERRVS